jgi:hypothetical protein
MQTTHSTSKFGTTRRALLLGGLSIAVLPQVTRGSGSPNGFLVYRNSSVAAIYNFASATELAFDPNTAPFVNPGMAISEAGVITSAIDGDSESYFDIGFFALDGQATGSLRLFRELASQTGAAVFNASGTRLALSVNELRSPSDNTRVDRVLILAMPSGTVVASVEGYEEPVWIGQSNELIVRDPDTRALYIASANLQNITRLSNLFTEGTFGAYSTSRDGRFLVYEDNASGSILRAFDLSNGARWIAATDATSDLNSPALSPNADFLAVQARATLFNGVHVVPFAPGITVAVDTAIHALPNTLAQTRGRMGWSTGGGVDAIFATGFE